MPRRGIYLIFEQINKGTNSRYRTIYEKSGNFREVWTPQLSQIQRQTFPSKIWDQSMKCTVKCLQTRFFSSEHPISKMWHS